MNDRRSLVDGLKATPKIDPSLEKAFVFQEKERISETLVAATKTSPTVQVSRSPFSTRIRSDLAGSLKRASLERQLANQAPNSVQEILEEVLSAWFQQNGYLPSP